MAENTSVGNATISLDIEASGDLKAQIEKMTGVIGKQIEASLKNIGNLDFKGLADTISNTISKAIDNSMKYIQQSVNKSINSALSNVKGIKIPVDFGIPTDSPAYKESAVGNVSSPRAPPIPKIKTAVNLEVIKSQIDNLSSSIDITNAKIEQQQEKLAGLKESYAMAFDGTRKNKLEEEILKTEATINKLTATSDKAGFKLADLDAQFAALGNMAKDATAGVKAVDEKLKQTANTANRTSSSMKSMGKATHDMGNDFHNSHNSMSMFFGTMVKWGLIFPIIVKGITAIGTAIRNSLIINSQFANSLNLIRSNLMTAFMPIYQAILPAVNTLMSALVTATAYIASFISSIFGKTYEQSFNAAKAMQTQIGALTMIEKQAKKTATSLNGVGNATKKASGGLAGFDQINRLSESSAKVAGTPGSGVITPITPMANMAPVETATSKWAEDFKKILSTIFQPFKNAWVAVGPSVTAEFNKAIEGTKATIGNFFKMLATPPVQQFLESIGKLVLSIVKLGLVIYNDFVLPIINWFINLLPGIVKGINPILDVITKVVNYLTGQGRPALDTLIIVLGSFALSWKGVTLAIKGFVAMKDLLSIAGTTLRTVIGFCTSTIGIWVIGIAAAIAIGILLYKNWDTIKAKAAEVWNSVKEKFEVFKDWLGSIFATDWSKNFALFGDILNGLLASIKNIFNSIKQIFNGIIDFVAGVFTGNWKRAIQGIVNVFGGVFGGISSIAKVPINAMISLLNTAITGFNKIKMPDWVPGVGGKGISIPKIPYLARGGVIDQPTLAMVGERGQEAVMPLENNTGWIDTLAGKLNSKGQSSDEVLKVLQMIYELLKDLGLDINLDGDKFARATIKQLNKRTRMTGKTELII